MSEASQTTLGTGASTTTTTADPASSNATAAASSTTAGQGGAVAFIDQITDPDIKNEPSLKLFKDVTGLAKSYVHAVKQVGADKIAIPGKNATDQDWDQLWNKLGRPESPEKYEFKLPENHNKEFVGEFAKMAHKVGILPKQAQELLSWYEGQSAAFAENSSKTTQMKTQEQLGELKKEWGAGWDKNVARAKVAVEQFGGDELRQFLNETGLGDNPKVIKLMAKIGEALAEDKIPQSVSTTGMTPQEAQSKIDSIMADSKHPYFDRNHPAHKSAMQEVSQLFKYVTSSQSA